MLEVVHALENSGDDHAPMSELRVQFHGYLPDVQSRRNRRHAGGLRPLPLQPLGGAIHVVTPRPRRHGD
jgi:hypothetical protein